uniref:PAS domain-containing protein n=1 Tax=Paractinoplanes polyasparticus TaxID=2856853 RepID=UPI001C8516BF|nr:PAS domain-containing protein [Actinoplanes polyasparticus]
MTAIADAMTEGVSVVDEQDRLLLRNPAVRRLVGGVVSDSGQMAKRDFYGLFHPDGTPLAPDEDAVPARVRRRGRARHGHPSPQHRRA